MNAYFMTDRELFGGEDLQVLSKMCNIIYVNRGVFII